MRLFVYKELAVAHIFAKISQNAYNESRNKHKFLFVTFYTGTV